MSIESIDWDDELAPRPPRPPRSELGAVVLLLAYLLGFELPVCGLALWCLQAGARGAGVWLLLLVAGFTVALWPTLAGPVRSTPDDRRSVAPGDEQGGALRGRAANDHR